MFLQSTKKFVYRFTIDLSQIYLKIGQMQLRKNHFKEKRARTG